MDDLKLYSKTRDELDYLVQTVRIFSNDIAMEFGIAKCTTVAVKRGKMVKMQGFVNQRKMTSPIKRRIMPLWRCRTCSS